MKQKTKPLPPTKQKFFGLFSLRIRLLPIVIGCVSLMFVCRAYDIKVLLEESGQLFGIAELYAEPMALDTSSIVENEKVEEKFTAPTSLTQANRGRKDTFNPLNLTTEEVRVLESLSARKRELDKKEAGIEEWQQVLLSLEQRINSKIGELQTLKKSIEEIVKYHDKAETAKLKSLVRIYEIMKPKEAANLFSKMNLVVLLEVLGQMKETKAAAVMGKMDPQVARIVTEELARRQEITDDARNQLKKQQV